MLCLPQNLTACWQCPALAALSSRNIVQYQQLTLKNSGITPALGISQLFDAANTD
jgi:hypothetical protein